MYDSSASPVGVYVGQRNENRNVFVFPRHRGLFRAICREQRTSRVRDATPSLPPAEVPPLRIYRTECLPVPFQREHLHTTASRGHRVRVEERNTQETH